MLDLIKIKNISFKKFSEGDSISFFEYKYIDNKFMYYEDKKKGFIINAGITNVVIYSYDLEIKYYISDIKAINNFSKILLIEKRFN